MKILGILIEAFSLQSINTIKTGFIWLLRVAWITGTLPILFASLPSSRLNSFHTLLLGFAKRGKIMPSSSHKFTVPQSYFQHFYVLAVVWTTMLLMGTWYFAYEVAPLSAESMSYPAAASHLIGGFYIAAPLSLCSFCALEVVNFLADQVAEFTVESQEMLSTTDFDLWGYVKPITRLEWCQWAGAAIFAWGWLHQYCCHAILGSLREHKDQTVEYVIPHGDWFDIVSSPHYLAEMIIYAGLLVASGGAYFTIWLLLVFVVANLAFAAAETHRWYLQKFDDYPLNRWAILPFVY